MTNASTSPPTTKAAGKADEIETRARERAGLEDFGSASYRPGLEMLTHAVLEADVANAASKDGVFEWCVDALTNRLRLTEYVARHPELRDSAIERPLIVIGMPRSGTTLVSSLLDADPNRRSLLLWESRDSVPPPTSETLRTDPRCLALRAEQEEDLASNDHVRPHWEFADGPTECIRLHAQDFKALLWEAFLPVREYSRWIMTADLTSAYEYEKMALQVLQSKAPGSWSLKMPSHALHIEWLVKVFPDARLVWTHRDPYRALGSLFSMKSNNWKRICGTSGTDWLREHYPWQLSEHLNRPMRLRERLGHERIYDLYYSDMTRDPIEAMRKLYTWAGDAFRPEVEAGMRGWLDRNPQGRFGQHSYDLEQFGLTTSDLEPWFAEYLAAYEPEPEGA